MVVAENHIGISFSYTRTVDYGFSGVVNSKIIGSLASKSTEKCSGGNVDTMGTNWIRSKCQAFSAADAFGMSSSCKSVLENSVYTRVGILISQSTNAAKSCAIGKSQHSIIVEICCKNGRLYAESLAYLKGSKHPCFVMFLMVAASDMRVDGVQP